MLWRKCGIGEGEFNLPHNLHSDADSWVFAVAIGDIDFAPQ